jgi:hypothetical protein
MRRHDLRRSRSGAQGLVKQAMNREFRWDSGSAAIDHPQIKLLP